MEQEHTDKDFSIFTHLFIIYFATASISFALLETACVKAPHYYPLLSKFMWGDVEGALSMGFDGCLLIAGLFGFIGTLVYLSIHSLAKKYHLIHTSHLVVVLNTLFWTALAISIMGSVREWIIDTGPQPSHILFNWNFLLLFGGLIILFFVLMFTAGVEHAMIRKVNHNQ